MSAPTLTEQEAYLLSRLGDAWVELGRGRTDLVRLELAEAQRAAFEITDAAAQTRAALFATEQNLKFVDNDNLGLKSALEAAHIAMTDALVYHHHTLGGPIRAALNAAINDANAVLRSVEAEAGQ